MAELDDTLIRAIAQRLREGRRVHRSLGKRGRISIDRPVPALFVYRRPGDRPDEGTRRLVAGQGSYLVADDDREGHPHLQRLVEEVTAALSDEFQAMLLLEIWSGHETPAIVDGMMVERPCFRIVMPDGESGRATVAAMARALRRMRLYGRRVAVRIDRAADPVPPGMPPLLTEKEASRRGALRLGLEVPPIYHDPQTHELYPQVLRRLHHRLARVLHQAAYRFAHLETSHGPEHYLSLGPRNLLRNVREADEQLAEVSDAFNLLLAVTPLNTEPALAQFRDEGYRKAPQFHYRLLNFDPDVLKRRLYGISLELVEDPALGELLRDKRQELDRQITLLHDRNSARFLYGSLQLYGGVEDDLFAVAEEILADAPRPGAAGGDSGGGRVGAHDFARTAAAEIERYRSAFPADFPAGVEVRDDVPGLLVSRGNLLVAQSLSVPASRVEALIHHEIGTHILTWHNATLQPLKLLASGLPGYEELQEGTAVMAEYLVNGLRPARLRQLAARVLAVRRMIGGSTFADVFAELHEGHGLGVSTAFTTTMRVFRGGGFTKDAVYLRGLISLLDYLRRDGEIELLFLGKVSRQALPILRELRWRELLRPPPLMPHYLEAPGAADRLDRLRRGAGVADLLPAENTS